VDLNQWYLKNTYHYRQFDIAELISQKKKKGISISLCFPTLNEAATIGNILEIVKKEVSQPGLVDEIVIIDSSSTDNTQEIVKAKGFPFYQHSDILKEHGSHTGKGEALWKSMFVLNGDIIVWCDSDIKNFGSRFVYGILGPLIMRDDISYVKAFYKRPININGSVKKSGGGRVTEILIRPTLNLFYPELTWLLQPLSGEYAGRRDVLEDIPFSTGYGVEIGMLIEIYKKFGLDSIAQVNLKTRIHRNQPLSALSKMSFGIMQSLYKKLERAGKMYLGSEVNKMYNQIHHVDGDYLISPVELEEKERPPIKKIKEYIIARK
jgi:glucosyl-3-phosphoglycerate synthase